jgi:ribulose-5-phosphate 4-epimerase/fuculose-1-phosphate aldolase
MDNLERVGRVELAAAFRLAVRFGFHEGIDNHFSLALSDDGREFLVNPYGRHFGELRASDLLRVTTGGEVLSGAGEIEPRRSTSTAGCTRRALISGASSTPTCPTPPR